MSHEKNPTLLSMKYWLVNRDPYNGLLKSLYSWVVYCNPLYTLNNQGFFHCSCIFFVWRGKCMENNHLCQYDLSVFECINFSCDNISISVYHTLRLVHQGSALTKKHRHENLPRSWTHIKYFTNHTTM